MYYFRIIRMTMFIAGTVLAGYFIECSEDLPVEKTQTAEEEPLNWTSLTVTASAYNSLPQQGTGDVTRTAWGDSLVPGMKSIAVSHDLIAKGLTYNTPVKIEGLKGIYIVNDKMHPKWKNKIDIYMGIDKKKALKWGRKKVEICFPRDSTEVITADVEKNR